MTYDEAAIQIVTDAIRATLASMPEFAPVADVLTAAINDRMRAEPPVAHLFIARAGDGGFEVLDVEPAQGFRVMDLPVGRWLAAVPGALRDGQVVQ